LVQEFEGVVRRSLIEKKFTNILRGLGKAGKTNEAAKGELSEEKDATVSPSVEGVLQRGGGKYNYVEELRRTAKLNKKACSQTQNLKVGSRKKGEKETPRRKKKGKGQKKGLRKKKKAAGGKNSIQRTPDQRKKK